MMRRNTILMSLAAIVLAGCEGGYFTELNLLTTQEEVAIGQEVSAEVEQQETVLDDTAVQTYVRNIGRRLAQFSPRQDVNYRFTVIDAPDTVNAFALPGGHMYVYTGLIKLCGNEAELAGVMAHEIGHVAGHHHGESMTRAYGRNLLASLILGDNPGAAAQIVAELASAAGAARYSREQEREADYLGMEILVRAGYPPDAMVSFMHKMLQGEQARGGLRLPIFSSHPATQERLDRLNSQLQRYPMQARNNPVNAAEYEQMKRRLR